jgi:NADH-quinone oxidoreductase subunit H
LTHTEKITSIYTKIEYMSWEWLYDFSIITRAIDKFLYDNLPAFWAMIAEMVLIGVVFLIFYALLGLILIWAERRVAGFFQNRLGPNRVGPFGIIQTIADLIKLLLKELISIKNADKLLFNIAPFIVITATFLTMAALPFAKGLHALDFNIGVFYVVAVSSVGVVGILLAGWSSNNKYSLIGAMRSGAQIISYELSVGLSLVTMVVLAGSMQFSTIVEMQQHTWFIFQGHIPAVIAFVIFLITGTAECNRGPFDFAEAESELTAGFHTEYSGIKFAFFMLVEWINMFIISAIAATVFWGGWMPLYISGLDGFNTVMAYIPPIVWFFGKTCVVMFFIMWFKWTFPRLRIDQLLTLEWKYLLPINLVNVLLMALMVLLGWTF